MAAKKNEAGQVAVGLAVSIAGGLILLKFGPKVAQALKGAVSGSPMGVGGSPSQQRPASQPSTGSMPTPGSGSSMSGNPIKALIDAFTGGRETVAQALLRGNTSIPGNTLASAFNLQQYGNPWGDSYDQTLAAFGLSTTPEDSLLSQIDAGGIGYGQQSPSLFDFGSWGWDAPGPSSDSSSDFSYANYSGDSGGYIDNYGTSTFDFGSYGQDPGYFGSDYGWSSGGDYVDPAWESSGY
jgi:hypothetical protein